MTMMVCAGINSPSIAEEDSRVCLLGIRILGTGADVGCIGKGRGGAEPGFKSTVCRGAWKKISWSKSDTQQTKDEVRENNAAWTAVCGGRPDPK